MLINCNPKTGIRYGVISGNSLDGDVLYTLFIKAEADAYKHLDWKGMCIELLNQKTFEDLVELTDDVEGNLVLPESPNENDVIEWIEKNVSDWEELYNTMEINGVEIYEVNGDFEYEGVTGRYSMLGGAPLIFVYDSPHITKANLCSPCVPNAGNLDDVDEDGVDCYNVPKEWRALC